MINDKFLIGLCEASIGNSIIIPSYLAFGSTTGTLTAVDTICSGEFDRNELATPSRLNKTVTYSCLRSGAEVTSSTGQYINVVALMNSITGGDLWANALVSSLLHTTDFDLDFEFSVTLDRA